MKQEINIETIVAGDNRIIEILGNQKKLLVNYRKIHYYFKVNTDDGILLFNCITQKLILIKNKDIHNFFLSDEAINMWFVVPESFDEQELVLKLRNKILQNSQAEKVSKYTIFTTTACNAKCSYCFEKEHRTNLYMSEDIANKVSNYIIRNSSIYKKEVELAWFGGEPLLNTKAIDLICNKLSNNNVSFYSTMISNGYLIDNTIINKAQNIWNLYDVQITLDGTEKVYNKTKNYMYKNTNPYYVVLNNIQNLINSRIYTYIRLNIDIHNGDNLLELVDELSIRFGGTEKLNIYCFPLYEKICGVDYRRNEAENRILATKYIELLKKIHDCRLYKFRLPKELTTHHCNPDSGREITILPNGNIGFCEHYLDSDFIGHIDRAEFNTHTIENFKERYDDLPECTTCPLFPKCIRLKKCDNCYEWCSDDIRKIESQTMLYKMLYEYQLYKSMQNHYA